MTPIFLHNVEMFFCRPPAAVQTRQTFQNIWKYESTNQIFKTDLARPSQQI